MTNYGDADGVRALHQTYGGAASTSYTQGTQLSAASEAIAPVNFMGNAADNWRGYVSKLGDANAAMSKAFDRVGSFLPRVAEAIEATQDAEKAEIVAADAVTKAQTAYTNAQTDLRTAEADATSPLSVTASPLHTGGPTAAQRAAVTAAQLLVQSTGHDLQTAEQTLQRARHKLEMAEDRRKSVLRQLSTLCQTEVSALQAAMPPSDVPTFAFTGGLIAELQMAERSIEEIPAIAGSFLAPDLLPAAIAAMAQDARDPQFQANIGDLYKLAVTPLKDFVPVKHQSSGGGSFLDWLGAGAVAVTSVGLIVVSAGTDSGAVLGVDMSLLGSMGVGAGVTGLGSEALAAGDALIHHEAITPQSLIIAGTTGWLAGAVPVGLTAGLLREAASNAAVLLPTRAAIGAVTNAGLNIGSQQYMDGNVHWGTVGVAAAGGAWGGAWPGAGELPDSEGTPLIGDSPVARVVLAGHASIFPSVVAASTDNAGPVAPKATASSH
jgi:hypothetical protein